MTGRTMELTISVVHDEKGMHGRIRPGGEPATDFTGWLGLIISLDRLLVDPEAPTDPT